MTDTERIELLKAVAERAPDDGYKFSYHGSAGTERVFIGPQYALHLRDDISDAKAIFAMLDAMEGAGWETELSALLDSEAPKCYLCDLLSKTGGELRGRGLTRAEAVARAFVAVFGGKTA